MKKIIYVVDNEPPLYKKEVFKILNLVKEQKIKPEEASKMLSGRTVQKF